MPYKDKKKQREYQRIWMSNRREQGIQHLGGKCVHCGSTRDLEIDHIDPSVKSYAMGSLWGHRWETILTELAKCQILCHECHTRKSRIEGSWVSGAKLTEDNVRGILMMLQEGTTLQQIADRFGVHRRTINDITLRKAWVHVSA